MDGENNGTPYFLMDDLGEKRLFFEKHPYLFPIEHGPKMQAMTPAKCVAHRGGWVPIVLEDNSASSWQQSGKMNIW